MESNESDLEKKVKRFLKTNNRNKRAHPRFWDNPFSWLRYQGEIPFRNHAAKKLSDYKKGKAEYPHIPMQIVKAFWRGSLFPDAQREAEDKDRLPHGRYTILNSTVCAIPYFLLVHVPILIGTIGFIPSNTDDKYAIGNTLAMILSNAGRYTLAKINEQPTPSCSLISLGINTIYYGRKAAKHVKEHGFKQSLKDGRVLFKNKRSDLGDFTLENYIAVSNCVSNNLYAPIAEKFNKIRADYKKECDEFFGCEVD